MPRIATMPLPSPCNPWHGVQKILKRPSPRSSSSWLIGSGKAFESFGIVSASSASTPRCTVFSRIGRSERPSVKKSDGESGRFFGCSAISCLRLHPPSSAENATAHITMRAGLIIIPHLADVRCVHGFEETLRVVDIEFLVARFDAQIKLVGGRVLHETIDVEQRMMRLGQFVSAGHPTHPQSERATADVHRVGVNIDPILEEESAQAAAQTADQRDQGHQIALEPKRVEKRFDWERRVAFDLLPAGFARRASCVTYLVLGVELTQHAVRV